MSYCIALIACLAFNTSAQSGGQAVETCIDDELTTVHGLPDIDSDGVPDAVDNCVLVANNDQRDSDNDAYGNVCDPDFNNDQLVNSIDLGQMRLVFFTDDPHADLDGDGFVSITDLGMLKIFFHEAPGPTGPCLANPSACSGPIDFEFDDTGMLASGNLFIFRTSDPATIHHARRLITGASVCNPQVQSMTFLGMAPYNPQWQFHMGGPVYFFGTSTGALDSCDYTAQYIETHLASWCNIETGLTCRPWCPWHSRLTREVPSQAR